MTFEHLQTAISPTPHSTTSPAVELTKDHQSIERLPPLYVISLAHSMPKKFHNPTFSKPASSAHPALATSSSSSPSPSQDGNPRPDTATSPSVNDLITRLRRSQATGKGTRDDLAPARTVHPSLKAILQVADTPPPRPRPGMRPVGGRSVRGPPGPPPPRSWLTSSIHAPKHLRERARAGAAERVAPDRLDRLPGVELPERSSLLHRCLKAIAANWKWHVNYDQYYLAGMPVRVKAMLLSYLVVYGDGESLDIDGLRTLFLDETELDGATGSEEITHLDLSGAMGQPITFKQLDQFFSKSAPAAERQLPTTPSPSPFRPPPSPTLDSWESAADGEPSTTIPQPLQTTRFPNLTSLSLSHPSRTASWPRLLHFATAHLATLTHLSLAFWPTPALTPNANAKITTTSSPYSPAAVSYGCSDFYGAVYGADDDWSEAAGVLMRLSRATYCLKSLDLEGCGGWLTALRWEGEGGAGGVEWCGGWRGVERVRVKAGWVPEGLDVLTSDEERGAGNGNGKKGAATETEWWDVEDERRKYYARQEVLAWDRVRVQGEAVEAWVRKKRRAVGGLRIEFETDSARGDVW